MKKRLISLLAAAALLVAAIPAPALAVEGEVTAPAASTVQPAETPAEQPAAEPVTEPATEPAAVTNTPAAEDAPVVLADGPVRTADGTFSPVKIVVAQIGDVTYASLTEALDEAADGQTVKVVAPAAVDLSETYTFADKSVALDLNGQTVTWTSSAKEVIAVKNGGGLTIQDSTDGAGALNIVSTCATAYHKGVAVGQTGSLDIQSGTLSYENAAQNGYAVYTNLSGSFTMSGGAVKISGAVGYGMYLSGTGLHQFTGGRIVFDPGITASTVYGAYAINFGGTTCKYEFSDLTVDGAVLPDDTEVVCVQGYNNTTPVFISGGVYSANNNEDSYAVGADSGNMNVISGGVFNGQVKAAAGKITGGQFSVVPSALYLPEGKVYQKQSDNYYHVVDGSYVGRIGSVGYLTWDELFADVSSGTTPSSVHIMSDAGQITVPEGKNVLLFNPKNKKVGKIVNNGTCKTSSFDSIAGVQVVNNGVFTLRNEIGSLQNNAGAVFNALTDNPKVAGDVVNHGTLNISKGTFGGNVTSDVPGNITGGTYATDVKDLCAKGYTTQQNREGTWDVMKDAVHVAEIDGYWYASLPAAVSAAKNGDTVKLLTDTTLNSEVKISNKTLTLDLGGHKITYGASGQNFGVLSLLGASNVTITGNGAIDFNDSYVAKESKSTGRMIDVSNSSVLTIENGTYYAGLTCILADHSAKVIIKGGSFSASEPYGETWFLLNLQDGTDASIQVFGGKFVNYDPSQSKTEVPMANFCAEGYTVTSQAEGSNTVYTVIPDPAQTFVAEVNGLQYLSVNKAVEAAANGEEVALLTDTAENVVIPEGKTVTLDLAGHTITNVSDHTIVNNGTLTIVDSGKTGTVDNVTHDKAAIFNNGTVTIQGGTYTRSLETQDGVDDGTDNSWYTVVNDGTMTINGGTFTTADGQPENLGNRSSLVRNGADGEANEGVSLTITGGKFTSGANILKNEPGSVIEAITGGEFTMDNSKIAWAGGNNLLQSYGTIKSITGGTFKALGDGVAIDGDKTYYRHGIAVYGDGKIEEIGGSVTLEMEGGQNRLIRVDDNGKVNVTGGSYELTEPANSTNQAFFTPDGNDALAVSGGTFSSDPTAYLTPDSQVVKNPDGTFGVQDKPAVTPTPKPEEPWTPNPTPTPTPVPAPTATPKPAATARPKPTATPAPTEAPAEATPTPEPAEPTPTPAPTEAPAEPAGTDAEGGLPVLPIAIGGIALVLLILVLVLRKLLGKKDEDERGY